MIRFNNIQVSEYKLLLKFPAYFFLLAGDRERDFLTKKTSVSAQYSELLRFRSHESLSDFFKDVARCFENTMVEVKREMAMRPGSIDQFLYSKLEEVEGILMKLDTASRLIMHRSLETFKDYISRIHHHVLVEFHFPIIPFLQNTGKL
ncbi:hypothetical protein LAG90_05095 [Marinilongibacter aquaticus]|uniref:hypothetical protein n=1 Tax=Marinilongibacter aquaticus TaxID=2975157 RepID=UPI0021BDC88E|nr:hypothetical protein [Marinilongibacter aquaticus]UBM60023.1 hypothetical protein LAG90_05095 [Marinilongibacter aquaticus]